MSEPLAIGEAGRTVAQRLAGLIAAPLAETMRQATARMFQPAAARLAAAARRAKVRALLAARRTTGAARALLLAVAAVADRIVSELAGQCSEPAPSAAAPPPPGCGRARVTVAPTRGPNRAPALAPFIAGAAAA